MGDSTFCKIKTEEIFKGNDGDPIVESSSFGWLIHGGDIATNTCMFTRESSDYEKLYTLHILGVEDRGANDQLDVCEEFKEDFTRSEDGRYEVNIPWIPGQHLPSSNAKPTPNTNSVNDCMFTGAPPQPLLWDILTRARMAPQLILADIQKLFLQIGLKEDRYGFKFLFNINGIEDHFRFTRIPFGVESNPFILRATIQHHLHLQPTDVQDTVQALKDNTYVDNIMQIGSDVSELEKFKLETKEVLESAKLPLHKWDSNVEALESEDMPTR